MPSYGSLHSPSLRKMNGNLEANSRARTGFGRGFSFGKGHVNNRKEESLTIVGHIVGDPFALATLSIAYVCLHHTWIQTYKNLADDT